MQRYDIQIVQRYTQQFYLTQHREHFIPLHVRAMTTSDIAINIPKYTLPITALEEIKTQIHDDTYFTRALKNIKEHIIGYNATTQNAFQAIDAAESLIQLIDEYERRTKENIEIGRVKGMEILERYNRQNHGI